ncbi:hypothetical protein FQA39_LY13233 [Lamprigera yunnana]|nr:hypothetical protein FQA39_LY13233 [Lamprigera yunnana]
METNQRMGVDSTYGALHEFNPNYLNNIICDKFIIGYNDGKIKDKLFLSDEKITFQEAVHQAKRYETLETAKASNTAYEQSNFFNRRIGSSHVAQNMLSPSTASPKCSGSPRVKEEPLDLHLVGRDQSIFAEKIINLKNIVFELEKILRERKNWSYG